MQFNFFKSLIGIFQKKDSQKTQELGDRLAAEELAQAEGIDSLETKSQESAKSKTKNMYVVLQRRQIAAKASNFEAMLALGRMHEDPSAKLHDPSKAAYWYRSALKHSPATEHKKIKILLVELWVKSKSSVDLVYQLLMAFKEHDKLRMLMEITNPHDWQQLYPQYQQLIQNDDLLDKELQDFYLTILTDWRTPFWEMHKKPKDHRLHLLEKINRDQEELVWPIINKQKETLQDLLHLALLFNWSHITSFLFDELELLPSLDGEDATVLLDQAMRTGSVSLAKYLFANFELENFDQAKPFKLPLDLFDTSITTTPVFIAAAYLNFEMLRYLIEEKRANFEDGKLKGVNLFKFIMLQACIREVPPEKLAEVLKIIAYISTKVPLSQGFTPLHYAAQYNNVPLAEALVEKLNADLFAENNLGMYPVHLAADCVPLQNEFRATQLKSYLAAKMRAQLKQEPGHLKFNGTLYPSTSLCSNKNVFLIECKTRGKMVAKQLPHRQFTVGDEFGLQQAYLCQQLLGYGERVFAATHPNSCFILMPYITGKPLAGFSEDSATINYQALDPLDYFIAFLETLEIVRELHIKYKLVHGDLNATNIILYNGKVTLIDFDMMREEGEPYQELLQEFHAATENYRAKFSDDIFALGVTFNELYKHLNTKHLSPTGKLALEQIAKEKLLPLLQDMMSVNAAKRPSLNNITNILKPILAIIAKCCIPDAETRLETKAEETHPAEPETIKMPGSVLSSPEIPLTELLSTLLKSADRKKIQSFISLIAAGELRQNEATELVAMLDGIINQTTVAPTEKAYAYLLRGYLGEFHTILALEKDSSAETKNLKNRINLLHDYQQAAYLGNIDAMFFLANIYSDRTVRPFHPVQAAFWYRCALKFAPKKCHSAIKLSLIELYKKNQPSNELNDQIRLAFDDYESLCSPIDVMPDTERGYIRLESRYKLIKNDPLLTVEVKNFFLNHVFAKKKNFLQRYQAAAHEEAKPVFFNPQIMPEEVAPIPLNRHIDSGLKKQRDMQQDLLVLGIDLNLTNFTHFLLEQKENIASYPKEQQHAVFKMVFTTNHVSVVKALCEKDKAFNLESPLQSSTQTVDCKVYIAPPVFFAGAFLRLEMLRYLIDEAKVNIHLRVNNYNLFDFILLHTCTRSLMPARMNEAIAVIKYMSTKLTLSNGLTPLDWAKKYNNELLAKALTESTIAPLIPRSSSDFFAEVVAEAEAKIEKGKTTAPTIPPTLII